MNIRLLLICFLLLVSVIGRSQDNSCWKILFHYKTILSGGLKKPQQLTLSSKEKGNLKLVFNCDEHPVDLNRNFLIMDQNRKEILRLNYENNKDFVLISLNQLKKINKLKPVDIYTVYTPKDSLLARTWRVKPLLLSTIIWKQ